MASMVYGLLLSMAAMLLNQGVRGAEAKTSPAMSGVCCGQSKGESVSEASGGCCGGKKAQQQEKAGGGCCGPQLSQKAAGCCAPLPQSPQTGGGCCGAPPTSDEATRESVQGYYSKLGGTDHLKTSACCTLPPPQHIRDILKLIHPEVVSKFYGCGCPIPDCLVGRTVVDLGSGTGRDACILSKLVGEKGKVIGVDMTDEQLCIANQYRDWHLEKFELQEPNVFFVKGIIEDLKAAGIQDGSVDLVISNCVINLTANKAAVMREVFRVLKPGGELYFSDMFVDRTLPAALLEDPEVLGECLAGAIVLGDFRSLLSTLGVEDLRIVDARDIVIRDDRIAAAVGDASFRSMTVRCFKMPLQPAEADAAAEPIQQCTYLGTIPECPTTFTLDAETSFEKGSPRLVSANTAMMLSQSRFGPHFKLA